MLEMLKKQGNKSNLLKKELNYLKIIKNEV